MPEILIDMIEEEFPEVEFTVLDKVYIILKSPSDDNP